MKKVAVAIAALFVLSIVAPAFSQPFADVPTDHWAFDAIAELAAKGIVEGYPDGTFKGDRAMTRYEMAMVVARLLARVEAIKIPPAAPPTKVPPPEVGRADIQTLQRLVNEFRAELAALGVRVTAVEEELAALRSRLDNVNVTGDVRFRYSSTAGGSPSISYRNRVTLTGRAAPNVSATARLLFAGIAGTTATAFSFETPTTFPAASFDLAYLDATAFGVNWRLGRQAFTLGQTGLLFDGAGFSPINSNDGLRASLSIGGFDITAAAFRHSATLDLLMARAGMNVAGFGVGFSVYSERPQPAGASSTGYGFDISGGLIPGVSFLVDFASWTPTGVTAAQAWKAQFDVNLGQVTGMMTFAPKLSLWYKSYGTATSGATGPLYNFATTEVIGEFPWDFRGWGTRLDVTISPKLSAWVSYETGTHLSTATAVTELWAGANYALAPRTTLSFQYFSAKDAGVGYSIDGTYRLALTYSY